MNLNYYPIDQCDMFLYLKLQKEVLLLKDEYLRKIALDDISYSFSSSLGRRVKCFTGDKYYCDQESSILAKYLR